LVTICLSPVAGDRRSMSVTDGQKVTATVVGSSAVTVAALFVDPPAALAIVATYFGFLGGLVMGHLL